MPSPDSNSVLQEELEAAISSLVAGATSPVEAVGAVNTIASKHVPERSIDDVNPTDNDDTPGAGHFFWILWGAVLDAVREGSAYDEHAWTRVDRAVAFIRAIKTRSPGDSGLGWKIWGETATWSDLPLFGPVVRDSYNGPFQHRLGDDNALYASDEGQIAIARITPSAVKPEPTGDLADIRKACEGWLLLNLFLAKLWRDADYDWALYSLWAIREGLEDLPAPLPISSTYQEDSEWDAYMRTPAYISLRVEVASLWLQTTAPLIYQRTDIWGPNGREDWASNRGAPGRGGTRWTGVDGFDKEHRRWALWKSVLREVLQWCEASEKDGKMKGFRAKEAAEKALEAMIAVETAVEQ